MTTKDQNKVLTARVIHNSVDVGRGAWKEISQAITAAGLAPQDWMEARAALQWLINQGSIKRTDSLTVEVYVLA